MSEPAEGTAAHACQCAATIMEAMKRKALDYLYEWNQLMLFLEHQKRVEARLIKGPQKA